MKPSKIFNLKSAIVVVLLSAAALLWLAFSMSVPPVPSFQGVRAASRPSDVHLLDRSGEVLHELRVDETRRRLPWTPLPEISPALQAAVITSEDRRFFFHGGVDGKALAAALLRRLTGGPLHGASTIPMQVVTFLHDDLRPRRGPRTLGQKWRQMRLAWAFEGRWSKSEILEAYLNLVTFRGELQGIRAAAGVLFGKAPHGLTEAEALVLAVLLRAPNAGRDAVARQALALKEAVRGAATREEVLAAVAKALDLPPGLGPRVALAPHAARRLLQAMPAFSTRVASVRSTLDGALQRFAVETLRRHLLDVRARHVQDGAVLVVGNRTGEDIPLDLSVAGGLYRPRNYDEQFKGLVTVRTALAASLNVPAVRTLALVGAEAFVQHLKRLGFEGLTESGDYYGPSLALGSADVSLWELTNAYRTLANGGVWSPLRMSPDEPQGPARRRLYSRETAFLLSHILSDRESRSLTFGLENPLATRFWSAVKTGTSKEMRDNWCLGYSRHYTVGVWVGNFSGEPMRDVSGITGAAPVWLGIMAWLHRHTPSLPPEPPSGVLTERMAFPREIEPPRVEWFRRGTEPGTAVQALAKGHPRILVPAQKEVIALDPDIPPSQQRIVFEAKTGGVRLRWVLDGTAIGSAADLFVWHPFLGKHTLSLVDEAGHLLDTITFEVRGVPDASKKGLTKVIQTRDPHP